MKYGVRQSARQAIILTVWLFVTVGRLQLLRSVCILCWSRSGRVLSLRSVWDSADPCGLCALRSLMFMLATCSSHGVGAPQFGGNIHGHSCLEPYCNSRSVRALQLGLRLGIIQFYFP